MFDPHLFTGEQKVYPGARFGLRAVNEQVYVEDVVINEADRFQGDTRRGEIGPAN